MGASQGIGRAIAGGAGARRAPASRSPAARGGGSRRRPRTIEGDVSRLRRRRRRPRSPRRAAGRGRGGARADRDPRHQHRRAAARRPRSMHDAGGVGARLPLARPRPTRARRRRRARDAGTRLGADRQRRLQLDPRADRRAQPLQLPTAWPQSASSRRSRARSPPTGITVNTVATGRFATERLASIYGSMEAAEAAAQRDVPAGRLGRPEEYGDLVAFLCSERAAYITGHHDPDRRRPAPLGFLRRLRRLR